MRKKYKKQIEDLKKRILLLEHPPKYKLKDKIQYKTRRGVSTYNFHIGIIIKKEENFTFIPFQRVYHIYNEDDKCINIVDENDIIQKS